MCLGIAVDIGMAAGACGEREAAHRKRGKQAGTTGAGAIFLTVAGASANKMRLPAGPQAVNGLRYRWQWRLEVPSGGILQ
jgi:hypothetical protein